MKKRTKSLLWLLGYGLLMLWLLFGQRIEGGHVDISLRGDAGKLNLIPFETVRLYWRLLQNTISPQLLIHAIVNLVGNVVMFVPLGLLLPRIWRRFHSFFRTVFFAVGLICLIEAMQYFTGLGSCDIDDLILNTAGVLVGYCIWKIKRK